MVSKVKPKKIHVGRDIDMVDPQKTVKPEIQEESEIHEIKVEGNGR